MRKSKATEALRVAEEVAAIRAALKKRDYYLRKRSKQASWSIYKTSDRSLLSERETRECYRLTYQPAPISSWVLHPQNTESDGLEENGKSDRHNLETVIQRALIQQSTGTRRVS